MGYILSANIARRRLTKGQRAMGDRDVYPEPEKSGRGKRNSSEKEGFLSAVSAGNVSEARTVLRWLPEVADLVLADRSRSRRRRRPRRSGDTAASGMIPPASRRCN